MTQKNMGAAAGDSTKGAGRVGIMDLLVMENIFYGRSTSRIYDLKVRTCFLRNRMELKSMLHRIMG